MSGKITEATWRDYLEAAALRATDSKAEQYRVITNGKDLDDDAREKTYKAYLERLKKTYPYNSIKQSDLDAIDMFDANRMRTFLDQYNAPNRIAPSPTEFQKAAKAADILPLLQGVAKEGNDWYGMQNDDLKEIGAKLGYNVRTQEGYKEFLDAIGEQQINYDRAKLAKEAKDNMTAYTLRKLIAPTAMQEFENAIATGGDYNGFTAAKLGALDAAANSAMFLAPSANIVKNPIVNGGVDALLQAAFEAGRQGGKQALSTTGQEFDIAPVLFAGGAGATKPAIVGTAQGAVSRIPGEGPAQFARGIAKAVKTGDPVYAERSALERAIAEYNTNSPKTNLLKELEPKLKDIAAMIAKNPPEVNESVYRMFKSQDQEFNATLFKALMDNKLSDKPVLYTDIVPLSTVEKGISVNSVPEKAKFFGVSPNADGTYDAAKILSQYDKKLDAYRTIDKGGKVEFGNDVNLAKNADRFVLTKDTRDTYRRLFPVKYTDEASETGASKVGRIAGDLLAGVGSRVEPTFKIAGTKVGLPERTYKDEQWYKNLSVKSRKIIDDAFKNKEEEEEE